MASTLSVGLPHHSFRVFVKKKNACREFFFPPPFTCVRSHFEIKNIRTSRDDERVLLRERVNDFDRGE